jgi:hypothetical protein
VPSLWVDQKLAIQYLKSNLLAQNLIVNDPYFSKKKQKPSEPEKAPACLQSMTANVRAWGGPVRGWVVFNTLGNVVCESRGEHTCQ